MRNDYLIKILALVGTMLIIGGIILNVFLVHRFNMLLDAIAAGDNQKVQKLVESNCFDLNKKGGPFPYKYLPGFNADVSPLEQACKSGNYYSAKILIQSGADASLIQPGHFSLLYLTLENTDSDDLKMVKLLVQNGADPLKLEENEGRVWYDLLTKCAFMNVSYTESEYNVQEYDETKAKMISKIYQYLEKYYVPEVHMANSYPDLHAATARQNIELISYLLHDNKYDVNCVDYNGETCAFSLVNNEEEGKCYSEEWKEQVLRLLIEKGLDLTIKNNDGKTVCDLAKIKGDIVLLNLLTKWMD